MAGENNVRFDFGLLGVNLFVAETTFEIDAGRAGLRPGWRRKFDLPEVEVCIAEGDDVDVAAGIVAETAGEADFGFAA